MKDNEADVVWIVSNDDIQHSYFIRKQALIRICAEFLNPNDVCDIDSAPKLNPDKNQKVTYHIGPSAGDKLATFSIDMLREGDYEVIDMKWLEV